LEKNNRNTMLGTLPIPKLILKMAPPAIVAQLVNLLYNIVDRIYIGHIPQNGKDALTGVGLCTPVLMFVTAFAMLASAGGAPRSAIAMGQGNKEEAERILGNCFSLLLLFAVGLTVALIAFAEPLLQLFGASVNTLPFALEYMRIYCCGSVFVLLTMGMNPFLSSQGFSTFAMLTTILGAATNIVLDPIFIFGFDMGVAGAAYATVISQAVSALFVLWFLTKGKRSILRLRLTTMKLRWSVVGPVLALGVSAFVMVATESILSVSFNSSLSRFGGDLSVGAMTIITSCSQLISMPTQGLVQGCLPIISYNYGARNTDRVKQCFKTILLIAAGYTVLFWGATMLMPQVFVRIFNSDADLVSHTTWAMRIYMAGIFSLGFQLTCQQTFVSLGQAKVSLLLACLRKLILLIPLIFILPVFLENRVLAVFLAEPVSDIIAAAVTVTVFFTRFDKILKKGPDQIGQRH
jgi:putative MATE family efflux protein